MNPSLPVILSPSLPVILSVLFVILSEAKNLSGRSRVNSDLIFDMPAFLCDLNVGGGGMNLPSPEYIIGETGSDKSPGAGGMIPGTRLCACVTLDTQGKMTMITNWVMWKGRVIAVLLCALAASSFMLTCSDTEDPTSGRITVVGSESVRRAMENEAREFMAMYGKTTVRVLCTGSVTGLQTMFEAPGTKDSIVAVSARPLSAPEREAALQRGFDPKEYRVAIDGIAIIVNAANPVESLSLEQVRDIFSGRIRNWQAVGGGRRPIRVFFGQPNSATYQQMRDSVLHDAGLTADAQHRDSMVAIIQAVQSDSTAIGYCGSSLLYRDWFVKPPYAEPGIKALALARTAAGPFVAPDPGTIYDKTYPLWRYVYLYTRREPKGPASGFVTFAMSAKGQRILVQDGLVPVTVKFIVNREGE
jgi:phosphate transport system substrate-binding protein